MHDPAVLEAIAETFDSTGGNVARAAFVLGISRRQMYRYLWRIAGAWDAVDRSRQASWDAFIAARARLGVKSVNGRRNDEPRV